MRWILSTSRGTSSKPPTASLPSGKSKESCSWGSSTAGKEREIRALPPALRVRTVDTSALRCEGVSSVSVDDRLSARMAVDYLLDCGHRKIAVMGGRREVDDGIGQRYRGVLQSFEARSLAFDERLYVESHFTMGCAYERALAFVRSGLECTAMFCMSDTMAIGAIKAFSEFGLRVPDDISVIGFDNIALARFLTPTLSTVSQPAQLIAEKSVELISRLIHDPSDTENVIVPSRLVQGGHGAPPGRAGTTHSGIRARKRVDPYST